MKEHFKCANCEESVEIADTRDAVAAAIFMGKRGGTSIKKNKEKIPPM